LRLFSRQNFFQPLTITKLLFLHGRPQTFHDSALLIEILSVIVQGSSSPIASQKDFDRDCNNCNNGFSKHYHNGINNYC
jgi:hypothetical protein